MECGMVGEHYKAPHFHPPHWHPPSRNGPAKTAWLNRLRTSVGRFLSCLHKWGMAPSVACECGVEQTVGHVILHFPIYRPPHGAHGLTVLDDEAIEWLLKT